MKLHQSTATVYVPDGTPADRAMARTSHLGIGAHQDDLEFMAFHGIAACHGRDDRWFGGVVCTNGSGSARTGRFASLTDEEMIAVRREEQDRAAEIGQYAFMAQLDYPSASIKSAADRRLTEDLVEILTAARPRIVYTHNPADKHDTHIRVTVAVIEAIRSLPSEQRPEQVLGCEVWRDLDWLSDEEKVVLDVSGHDPLAQKLNEQFASQIEGGKRYDRAIEGRRFANATFLDSHSTDTMEKASFAMDLTPLTRDDNLDLAGFTTAHIDRFRTDVKDKLKRCMGL